MPKQVIVHAPYDVRLDEAAPIGGSLGDFELLVQAEVGALSPGTETRIYSGGGIERFSYRISYPFPLGYNNVGKIVAVGKRVQGYRPGQRVFTCMPHLSEFIVAEQVMGEFDRPSSSNIPKSVDQIALVPENVSSEHAVFTHLLLLGFNALQRGQYRFGENVLVIGLGVVGLGAVCMAQAAGARVAAIGNAPFRLETARSIGADAVWLSGDDDLGHSTTFAGEPGIDLIIICTDAWEAMKTAITISRRNTRIAVLAFPGVGQGPSPFEPFEPGDFYNRSLSYIAVSWMATDDYPPEYQRFTRKRVYRYILDLMCRRRIDLSPLVTHHFPMARMKDAFDLVLTKDKSVLGVVLDWNESE